MTYDEFFEATIGAAAAGGPPVSSFAPYEYQRTLATGPWPELLDVPTGLGKTAAITGAWLYRRLTDDPATPRRLVWCLPMRVLVEQTYANVQAWLTRARPLFEEQGLVAPNAHVLMGGEADDGWVERPEHPAVIIGTQDMLLSRALMRGYGASRYRWPVDFALLHNDALWVFDEVQLMGAGLPTSAQLEAFRRDDRMPPVLPSRTVWSSATMRRDWLDTVDFRSHLGGCRVLGLHDDDRRDPRVVKRVSAPKRVVAEPVGLTGSRKGDLKAYLDALGDAVYAAHDGSAPTLVIVNRVARAQELYQRLRKHVEDQGAATALLLVHARFRAAERAALNQRLRDLGPGDDVIIVATQAVEAGVDLTSRQLFTELAPWASLVQRFGRCNRGGEYDDATIHWLDIDTAVPQLALPYETATLDRARDTLRRIESAAPADLPPVEDRQPVKHVLRRKDLLELFNTEPDLSGFDIDVSPYLRDASGADVQVFWRVDPDSPEGKQRPARDELCAVPIGAARDHLKSLKRRPRVWNGLSEEWERIDELNDLRPGQVLMLDADAGGYDPQLGFVAGLRGTVAPVARASPAPPPESMGDDPFVHAGRYVELAEHLLDAQREASALAEALPMAGAESAVVTAALWHDTGKAHPAFHTAILAHADPDVDRTRFWAKSANRRRRLNYGIMVDGKLEPRRHFRHELASALAWLGADAPDMADNAVGGEADLVAYLIAAHHGKVRMALRALPKERRPPDGRSFARGVWAGDEMPAIAVNGLRVPPVSLRLDIMLVGEGEMGASWSARTAALLERWGPFRLAWLETMVRVADWRASGRRRIFPDSGALADLCRRWRIERLSLFGSVLTGQAHPDSDVDLLVEFEPSATPGHLGMAEIADELSGLLGRKVDLRHWRS